MKNGQTYLKILILFLFILPIAYSEITEPLHIVYCRHMGYTVEINSENIPTCNFGDDTVCTTTQFWKGECAQDKIKPILPRKEGETVYVELGEKCEEGLMHSEPQYALDQPICIRSDRETTAPYDSPGFPDDNVCIMFFYGIGCPHCKVVDEFLINEFLPLYRNRTHIYRYEIYNNPGNSNLFRTYAYHYNFTFLGVPTVIVGDNYFIGDAEIIDNLIPVVESYVDGVKCKSLPLVDPPLFNNDSSVIIEPPELPWYMKSVDGLSRFVRFIIITILIYGGLVILRKIYRFSKSLKNLPPTSPPHRIPAKRTNLLKE